MDNEMSHSKNKLKINDVMYSRTDSGYEFDECDIVYVYYTFLYVI